MSPSAFQKRAFLGVAGLRQSSAMTARTLLWCPDVVERLE